MRGAMKKTRPWPATDRQYYLHVTPRAQLCPHKNMTLIFIGLQNTIYYLIKCTVRTKDGRCNCALYYCVLYAYIRYRNTIPDDELQQTAATRLDLSASYNTRALYTHILDGSAEETRVRTDIIGQTNATCSDHQGKHNKNSNNNIMTNSHII